MERIIKVVEVEGGYRGAILIFDREQTSLFFCKEEWNPDQIIRRLSRYMPNNIDDDKL